MRIKELDIIGFGKIVNQQMSFSDEITLIYGPNEAGKSTIYHFIREILFGFPRKKSSAADYQPKSNALYGGSLIFSHPQYGEVTVTRIKSENGGKALVKVADGPEGDDEFLQKILAPLTRELFDDVYSLEQSQLNDLQILGEDRLQSLLLSIGLTGSKKLVTEQLRFQKNMQEIFKPRGRNPLLNQLLRQYDELKNKIVEKEQLEATYQQQIIASQELHQTIQETQQQLDGEREKLAKINKQLKQLPEWENYQKLKDTIRVTNKELDEQDVKVLQEAYQRFNLLLEREREIHEEQLRYYGDVESPKFAFFLNNELRFQEFLSEKSEMEELNQEKIVIERLQGSRKADMESLREHLGIPAIDKNFYPMNAEAEEMLALAQKETSIINHRKLYNDRSEQLKHDKEQAGKKQISRREQRSLGNFLPLLAGVVFLALGIVGLVMKTAVVGIFGLVSAVTMFGYYGYFFLERRKNYDEGALQLKTIDREISDLEHKMNLLAKDAEGLEQKKARLSERFQFNNEHTIETWLNELNLRHRLFDLTEQYTSGTEKMIELQGEMDVYRQKNLWLSEWFKVEEEDFGQLLIQVSNYIYEMQEKKQAYVLENSGKLQIVETLQSIKDKKKQLSEEYQPLLNHYGLHDIQSVPTLVGEYQSFKKMVSEAQLTEQKLEDIFDLEKVYKHSQLTEQQEQLASQVETHQGEIEQAQEKYESMKFSIQKMASDGLLNDLYQKEAGLKDEINQLQSEWIVQKLLNSLAQDVQDFLGTQQFPALLSTCASFFKELTVNAYEDCFFEDGYLLVRHQSGQVFQVKELSTGTRDQLYMAMRLSFVFLNSEEHLAPLMIDDSWLHYDIKRKHSLFKVLKRLGESVQIVCFSSDTELADYASKEAIETLSL
ncbi:AAA family ATPase [Vagococcus elongatus]|uniref:YhaN AAA domain-containing protein n=1 Tax=Vagococcus elongatus TaxID=180344 RepID=A0A430ALU6_9ENTE|nr:AAA family ATPase [Vagococcus elongatus]RSU08903.1 hypothetical protein CBF29_12825 [Vagococcus elongatus]